MLTAGDEDLGAADAVAAIRLRLGAGADDAEVGAGVRLGQAHGAGPAAFVHRRQVGVAQLFAGVGVDRQAGAGGQRRIQGEAVVGGIDHFLELHGEHLRHAHAAELRVTGKADPAAFDVGGIGFLEAGRRGHHAVFPLRTLLVPAAVQRREKLAGDFRRFFQDGVGSVAVDGFRQFRQTCPQCGRFEYFMQDETHVAQGGVIGWHCRFLESVQTECKSRHKQRRHLCPNCAPLPASFCHCQRSDGAGCTIISPLRNITREFGQRAMREHDSVAAYFVLAASRNLRDQPARLRAVLDRAGIDPDSLEDAATRLPASAVTRFWLEMTEELGDEFFGFDSHGLPCGGFAMICRGLIQEPTLGKALKQFLKGLGLFLHDIRGELDVRGGRAVISLRTTLQDPAIRSIAEEIFLSIVLGVLCWLAGRRIPLNHTRFGHPRPQHGADPLLWGPLLEFDAPCTEVTFDASYLRLPVVQDLPALKHFLRTSPQWLVVRFRNHDGLAAWVYRRLRHHDDPEWPTQNSLAQEHGMTPTAFRRQLEREGFSFQELKHEARRAIAFEHLHDDRLSISEIALRSGFQESSAFHRAFRQWTGESPGQFRQRLHKS
ncbi:Urease operon transcriptional activator [compost metagenome]